MGKLSRPKQWILLAPSRFWDATAGQELLNLRGCTDIVHSVAWSPDGRRLVSASGDQTVKVWDAATGQELLNLPANCPMTSGNPVQWVAWSPDSQRLASVSQDQTIKVWEATTGQKLLTLRGHTGPINAVAWHPDGRRLASAGIDQMVKIWDITTGQELLTLRGPAREVKAVSWNPDGERLTACYREGTVRIWDTTNRSWIPALARWTNNRAWLLVTNPNTPSRDPDRAVALARYAIELNPHEGTFWNTLAVAHSRGGEWKAAAEALSKSMELREGGDSFDWFFLAMAHWQLGEKEQARKWYTKAVRWMDKNKPQDEELRRFRAEATALLGIKDASTTTGKAVSPKKE